jgi:hypothetical protein
MAAQFSPDRLTEGSAPFAVNHPDLVPAGHKGVMQVPVEFQQGFIHGHVAQPYFILDCWPVNLKIIFSHGVKSA